MMRRSQRLLDWLQICKYADIPSSAAPLAPMNPAFMLSIFPKSSRANYRQFGSS
jgi:hypothetical protein